MDMKIKMGRHIREGLKNLVRNGWMTFASVSAVTITLLILGVTLMIALNAQQLSKYAEGQLEVTAFLQMNVDDTQAHQIADHVKALPGVQSVDYVSKDQGFQQLQNEMGAQYNDVLGGLSKENTLPIKLVVKPVDPNQTLGLAQEIRNMPGVDKVFDGKDIVGKLLGFLNVVRNIGLVFIIGLVVTAMFLISNTIKITIFSRRREIEIMKLVGATNWFIRWPFLTEGMMIGAVGALIPFLVITLGYHSLFAKTGGVFMALQFQLVSAGLLAGRLAIVMFGLGIIIGVWGGIMSVRKFLRI
jgi:cell division transport system permease protein